MGNKNSGRRVRTDEQLRRDTIQKAWQLTHERLTGSDLKRFSTAEALCLKDMVSKVEAKQDIGLTLTQEEQDILKRYADRSRN